MNNDGYLFFDETPKQCPGCGNEDRPAPDGPSYLMILWVPLANIYLCIDCRYNLANWESCQAAGARTEHDKPQVVNNLELLAQGKVPGYVKD